MIMSNSLQTTFRVTDGGPLPGWAISSAPARRLAEVRTASVIPELRGRIEIWVNEGGAGDEVGQ